VDLSEFDYYLPESSIAQQPLSHRSASRMLVVDRETQQWEDRQFREFPSFLRRGDCLVLNTSRVFPSRLFCHRAGEKSSGAVEVFLLRAISPDAKTWEALVRPGRKLRSGERIRFDNGIEARILARSEFGERTLRFETEGDVYEMLNAIGHVPLPPYIKRPDSIEDRERYQTVFAREKGSVAAPTAGLHFTAEILERCRKAGATIAEITLHVGLGTFQPVRGEKLHAERFEIPGEAAERLRAAQRTVCVGTTSVRAVESMMLGKTGETDLFIRPGFAFQKTGAMLTNFHLPQSSLLMLVCALAGKDLVLSAYKHAVESGYRFYSYGDCMLIV
jgi:S-adenosylmethionine:tRNA ribosyltransferase-isomerase